MSKKVNSIEAVQVKLEAERIVQQYGAEVLGAVEGQGRKLHLFTVLSVDETSKEVAQVVARAVEVAGQESLKENYNYLVQHATFEVGQAVLRIKEEIETCIELSPAERFGGWAVELEMVYPESIGAYVFDEVYG